MPSLSELPADELKIAHDAAETTMGFRVYLPGGLLMMLLSRFRDDIREALYMELEESPRRGRERRSLDELTSVELDSVWGAVLILLQDRFTAVMDDPALLQLLDAYRDDLSAQRLDRERIRATMAS